MHSFIFYDELCTFLIGVKVLVIGPFNVFFLIYISIYFANLVRFFFELFGVNEWSK